MYILQLESFLKVRLLEMQGDNDLLTLSHLSESTQSIAAMLDSVQVAKSLISDPSTQHLHNVKHSPRFLDHLVSTVEHKRSLIEKLAASQQAVHQKGKEALEEAQNLQNKQKLIVEKTKELQTQIEKDISKKYKNRPVNLMGGVATL
uniref:Uncharacterized protein n=1 Tax=Clastoptera arizonana TaxID=38151 RepID=A0A1B6DP65_9HEMI